MSIRGLASHAVSRLQFVARIQEPQAGAGWIPRVVRCTAVAEVVAVVGLLYEIRSTLLRNLCIQMNDVICLVE
jgi:hypothetical protein